MSSAMYGQGARSLNMYIEAGAGTNLSYFDVGGGSPGVSVRGSALYELRPSLRVGACVGFHRTRGTDEGTASQARGYEFKSNLNEISAKGVYVVRFNRRQQKRWKQMVEPRAYASLGVVQIQSIQNRPLSSFNGEEGLNVAPLFSGGVGTALILNNNLSLLIEGGTSLSSSDFLEGYAGGPDSRSPDLFHTFMVNIIYKVPSGWH